MRLCCERVTRITEMTGEPVDFYLRFSISHLTHGLFDRARQLNHARNIWDRAITILPRANQFWYKYTYMEEMLGHIAGEEFFLYKLNERRVLCHSVFLNFLNWSMKD